MPKVRYHFKLTEEDGEQHEIKEEDILPPGMDIDLRGKQQSMDDFDKLYPRREFIKAEIVDPFLHEHHWVVTIGRQTTGGREYLECQHPWCKVEATRNNDGPANNTQRWQSDFYEFCHEPKPKPKPFKFKA